jgi:alanine racemase
MTVFDEHSTYAEIDLDAIATNVRVLKAHIGPQVQLIAVVKANAYGHGVIPVAREVLASGADRLAVARPDEAIQLRQAEISAPILVMGYSLPSEIRGLVEHNIAVTVNTREGMQAASSAAAALGIDAAIQLKVDTGMGRFGLLADEVSAFLKETADLPHLHIEGLYTHFATADEHDKTYANQQLMLFQKVLAEVEEMGIKIPLRHAANSAATIDLPAAHLDAVRCGVAVYGLKPSLEVSELGLKPALSLKSHVARVRSLPAGSSFGYGRTFIAQRQIIAALIPAGYGDGYHRVLSSKGVVLIRGQRAPVIGRVSMDQMIVDATDIPGVAQDDEVVLIGRQGNEQITADEIARLAGTINYEVTTSLLPRVPRVMIRSGQVVEISRPLIGA